MYTLTKKSHKTGPGRVAFTIPIFDPIPPQYYVHALSETWLHSETVHEASGILPTSLRVQFALPELRTAEFLLLH